MRISKIASRRVSPILTLWAFLLVLHYCARYRRLQADGRLRSEYGVVIVEALWDVELLLRWPWADAYV